MTVLRSPIRLGAILRATVVAVPILVLCALSATALTYLGVDYVVPGGAVYAKIHPGTYMATAAVVVLYFCGSGSKITAIVMNQRYRLSYYFAALFALFAYAAILLSVPFMNLIDNWFLAGVIVILFAGLSLSEIWLVARIIDIFMIFNSVLGLIEVGTNWRLVPLTLWSAVLGQWVYPFEWRATALLGHPLSNSYVVGSYLLALLITKRIPNLAVRLPLMGLHIMALSAFGSRAAASFFALALVIYMIHGVIRGAVVGRIARDIVVYIGTVVLSVVLLLPAILSSGFADRYIERFSNDGGSAHSRNVGIELITSFSWIDIVMGPPAALLFEVEKRYGIIAIESFWLHSLMTFGLIGCAFILFPMIYWLCRCIVRESGSASGYILVYFLACCTTSLSMGAKTVMMPIVIAICMTSLDFSPLRARRTAAARPVARRLPPQAEPNDQRPLPEPASGVPA